MESVYTPKMCLLAASFHQISTTKNGEPKTRISFGLQKCISFILSDAKFNGEITVQIRAQMVEISPENSIRGQLQDKRSRLSPAKAFAAWSSRIDARRQYSPLVYCAVLGSSLPIIVIGQ